MCVLLCRIYTLKNLRQVAFELAKWLGARKLEASQGFPAWVSGCPLSSLVMKTTGCVEGLRALVACGQLSGFALFHNLFPTRQKVPGSNPVEGGKTGKHALHINQDNFSCSWVIDNFKKNIPAAIFTRNPFLRSKSPYLKKIISTGGPEMKLPIPIRIYSNAIPKRISSNAIPILHNTYLISYIHLWCSLCYC